MRALEEVDMNNIVPFLIGNCDLPIGVPPAPDFSGHRVKSYCQIIEFTSHLSYINRAFPSSTDGEDYLEYCPPEFDKSELKKF